MGGSVRGRGGRDVDLWDMWEGRVLWREREGEFEMMSCEVVFVFLMVVRVLFFIVYVLIDFLVVIFFFIVDCCFICVVVCVVLFI